MNDELKFEHITTEAAVETFKSSGPIFESVLKEVRELSRKKPDATMSSNKVKLINRVLTDLLTILKDEPTGKYLDVLSDEALPQVSDALLAMVQFQTALNAFQSRYRQRVREYDGVFWITSELLNEWRESAGEDEDEDEEDDDEEDDEDESED